MSVSAAQQIADWLEKLALGHSRRTINPTGIIPLGPRIDFTAPTRRAVPKLGG
jgi:glutathionyl-hydroquinone reductase